MGKVEISEKYSMMWNRNDSSSYNYNTTIKLTHSVQTYILRRQTRLDD